VELKKVSEEELISGEDYLTLRPYRKWMVAQYCVNEYDVGMWYGTDGLTYVPIEIYELPKRFMVKGGV
jgi:hypothetical protein